MNIYAIADLHLSGNPPKKPMNVFGDNWTDHWDKIRLDWRKNVENEDIVLLPGDISWAMNFEEAEEDLLAIDELPGTKILVKGNHDYWWTTSTKMRAHLPPTITFIHNSYIAIKDVAVCGSRGWINPLDTMFTEQDRKVYEREKCRIDASIKTAQKDGFSRIILVTHYPMIYSPDALGSYASILAENKIEHYVYGHLHGEGASLGPVGIYNGVNYHLVSCDALNFRLQHITQL